MHSDSLSAKALNDNTVSQPLYQDLAEDRSASLDCDDHMDELTAEWLPPSETNGTVLSAD